MAKVHSHGKKVGDILHQVPVDYYQKGVSRNILQKIWHTNKLRNVASMIRMSDRHPKRILDVGSASGWFLSELSKKFPRASYYGVDLYKEAVLYGNKLYKNLTLIHSDAHTLPFKKEYFDVVICCEVLEHVEGPDKVLKEIRRVLTKDGIAVIEIDSGNFLFRIVWYWWTNVRKGVWIDSHIHVFTFKKLETLFKKNGFIVKKKKMFNASMGVVFLLEKK